MASSPEANRGRTAEQPEEIPAPGWWDIASRVKDEIGSDNVSLISGGLAMYALLAVFPALAAAFSAYGLFATPADVLKHMSSFSGVLPKEAWDIINTQLQYIASRQQGTLTVAAVVGLLVALWSARSGMAALITATNIAYSEREKRGFFMQILLSLLFTVAAIMGFVAMLLLGVAVPVVLEALGVSKIVTFGVAVLRWGLLWFVAVLGLALIYRFAPSRQRARWRWVTWGSVIASTLWVVASLLFAYYVRSFGTYGKTYGALGGVIVLLMWFYISSFVVVLGAEINAEMERQTKKDTTEGPPAPLGQRGAYAADTVGPSREQKKKS